MRPIALPIRFSTPGNLCRQCSRQLRRVAADQAQLSPSQILYQAQARSIAQSSSRAFSRTLFPRATAFTPSYPAVKAGYFSSNTLSDQENVAQRTHSAPKPGASAAPTISSPPEQVAANELLPHRRRQAHRRAANDPNVLPQNASDILTSVAAAQPAHSLRRQVSAFLSLAKPRLTVLVVLTAMAPYALYPVPAFLSPLAETPSLSPLTLLFLTTGTTLCSASANALNMLYEPSTDAKMSRTRNRPLVRQLLTTRAAVLFAVGCGVVGTAALYWGVNPTVAFLGALNIVLYAGVYTPMKRLSWLNTWVGALVGGIPPLMGWAAAAGESATGDGAWRELLFASDGSSLGGWLMAGLLFAWQFPHFMALSWSIRDEYKNAGLKMLSWVNPARNGRVALRYSLVFVPICVGLCMAGVTEWTFAVTSLPANVWLVREAWRFWRQEGHKGSARGLFWASVWHLPAVLGLALLQKKGMWQRVWNSIVGEPVDDEEWEDVDDEVDVVPIPIQIPITSQPLQERNS
ncbi:Protoheme IX farnesyltransferase, mitochondrial [Gnomoniopsis smithogilvyi]|uniref:Protoheme IX farnesyltransferase, mitochondrial n=1 Tax=Gnomoniopsis smithogilvyi TaxID=1191159 RepID=A0A9W8YVT5_9PEZI|nr:Protoheme IX farnesyltransferase, mitochondrial [Gnomoniopsis smithogilvyi]